MSLALALFVGAAGLPHLLMRVFTVPDARAARTSTFWGCVIAAYFFSLIFIIGFGGLAIVGSTPAYLGANGAPIGGGNMVALHLSHALVGGGVGLVSALVLTILGPPVWVKVLGNTQPIFPLDPPTLVTLPLALATCVIVSILDRSAQADTDRAMYERQRVLLEDKAPSSSADVPGGVRA